MKTSAINTTKMFLSIYSIFVKVKYTALNLSIKIYYCIQAFFLGQVDTIFRHRFPVILQSVTKLISADIIGVSRLIWFVWQLYFTLDFSAVLRKLSHDRLVFWSAFWQLHMRHFDRSKPLQLSVLSDEPRRLRPIGHEVLAPQSPVPAVPLSHVNVIYKWRRTCFPSSCVT